MIRRYFRATRLLESGMKIDQSIIDGTGRVLIARGTILNDYLIDALRRIGVSGVYIREGQEEVEKSPAKDTDITVSPETARKIEKLKVADPVKVKLNESVRARVAEGMAYMYSNTSAADLAGKTKSIADDLLNAINENDALAVDIDLLKVSDEYTFKHSVDVATMAMVVARNTGMSRQDVYDIGVAGLLHDIGKAKVPTEILNKPGKLTEEEFAIIKKHPGYGYEMIKDNPELSDNIKRGVLQHHEKINGTGYPVGIKGTYISWFAKILSIADIYDALVTERPYKMGFSPRDAVEMIMSMTYELDVDAMKAFLESVILYPVDSVVTLSNGEKAKVVQNYKEAALRPKVVGLQSGKIYDLANDLSCASIIIQ